MVAALPSIRLKAAHLLWLSGVEWAMRQARTARIGQGRNALVIRRLANWWLARHVCEPTCPDFCYSCAAHEPMSRSDYRVCGECFHTFRTEGELVRLHNEVLEDVRGVTEVHPAPGLRPLSDTEAETAIDPFAWVVSDWQVPPPVTSGKQIFCCPKCSHDF